MNNRENQKGKTPAKCRNEILLSLKIDIYLQICIYIFCSLKNIENGENYGGNLRKMKKNTTKNSIQIIAFTTKDKFETDFCKIKTEKKE